jgi:GDP-L-fucose synthase
MKKVSIFVAGHKGLVGSTIAHYLKKNNKFKIITKDRKELDLRNQAKVYSFFKNNKIDQVYLAAARVGGILANKTFPAEFIYENLQIQNNIIHSSFLTGVKKLMFLGSSCIYPKNAKQPIEETELLKSELESTNEAYAIAKIAGLKMCQNYNLQYGASHGIDYRCVMPTNLYGPGDNFNDQYSHVIPGLIHRFHNAKINNFIEIKIWGTGKPRREFLFIDDLAKITIKLMNLKKEIYEYYLPNMCSHINIGSGKDISIGGLALILKKIIGYKGKIIFDTDKPDGVQRKLLNSTIIKKIGFKQLMSLERGIFKTYKSFLKNNGKN